MNVLGFDDLKDMYKDDAYLKDSYASYENPVSIDKITLLYYMIQEGVLFKGNKLCLPRCSMRGNLSKEKHSGGLAGNFGQGTIFVQLNVFYF